MSCLCHVTKDVIINCTASGHGALLFGDNDGTVYMVTRSFEVASFQAYEEYIQHMYQLKTQGILVTVGVSQLPTCSMYCHILFLCACAKRPSVLV
jgi:hypothetical protein